ncbi:MAG: carbohydrate ABC transporter permease [Clostridia bacterium]|nr:carbohydrate ABC transporter permease [Clostridia bacterium]
MEKQKKLRMKVAKKKSYKRFTRSRVANVLFVSFLLLAGLFMVLPLIYSVMTSFKPLDELMAFPPKFYVTRPTLYNYTVLPSLLDNLQVPFSRYAFNTLFISVAITVGHVILSGMAAFTLSNCKHKLISVVFWSVQVALLFNGYTLGIPQYLIFSKLGIIDTYWVYILPALQSTTGVFLMKQYMDVSVPKALMEAALLDGAGYYRIFWTLVMPLVKPAWLTLSLFAFRDAWAMQPGGTIFSENLKTLPVAMNQIAASGIARSGSVMAATVLLMIPPILVYLVSQSNVMETMSSAGMKD